MELDRAVSLEWNDTKPGSSSWSRGRSAPVKEGRSYDDKGETGNATYCRDWQQSRNLSQVEASE